MNDTETAQSEAVVQENTVIPAAPKAKRKSPVKAKAKVAKKAVKAKPAKKAAKKNGKSKNGNGKPRGALTEKIHALLKKGTTRADLLAATGWPAINVYQFVPKSKLVVAKSEGERGLTYRLRK